MANKAVTLKKFKKKIQMTRKKTTARKLSKNASFTKFVLKRKFCGETGS